ncbi:YheC/YheD family protein [Paenibacillus radicis (ex Xue et al. 2023)]|uniref:YheC/YheD family protein n=1 Tax=Paenibacillus radicis (ex Xue et al. 2023) TaxID=2972489 RepID=A0ABT1YN73_9BACL|nr:YheC/YheD family protein [Paenibacillus radicis (ex Xue et al. 2023)]MCR8634622.1 YheC/YheD family protein [Paenibacillus radicis (ex Xue et al. 2023)]
MSIYQLGVLAMYLPGRKLEELSFFRKLSVHGQKLGIEVLVFTPDDLDESMNKINALFFHSPTQQWRRKWIPFPGLIYDRCRYHGIDNFHKISKFRSQNSKLRYLSKPLANKWTMYQILSEKPEIAAHLPATVRYNGDKELIKFLKQHRRVFLKPRNGTGGRGIVRLQSMSDSLFILQGRDPQRRIINAQKVNANQISARLSGWKLEGRYIVQQGIPLTLKDGRVHDFRMLVQKNGKGQWQITGCAGRVGPKNSVTSNLHGGGSAIPMEALLKRRFADQTKINAIKNDAYELGMKVAHFTEEKFGIQCEIGIDLAVDPSGKVWLLEVNPKPSREVFYRIGEREIYRNAIVRPLEYALWLFKKKPSDSKEQ